MKNYILQLILIFVLLTSCAPSTANKNEPVPPAASAATESTSEAPMPQAEVGKMLDGVWKYECDAAGLSRYTWKSWLKFAHADMVVEISFTDLDIYEKSHQLAFMIMPEDPKYATSMMYVKTTGEFTPELTYFDTVGLMEVYPGGYPAFEEELIAMNIDWVNMYLMAKTEFFAMYIANNNNNLKCQPYIPFDTQIG